MQWKDLAKPIGAVAPLLGGLLLGPGGAAAGRFAAQALGVDADPGTVSQALRADPDAAVKLQQIESAERTTLAEIAANQVIETARSDAATIESINSTIRTEAGADDAYVRRWRPTWGYVTAATWTLQTVAIVWAIVAHPDQAPAIITAIAGLSMMWGIALAVLGVSIHKRSQDKQVASGQAPTGLLDLIKGSK